MVNLTIALDEETFERARSKASEEGTSVDTLVRSYLEAYTGVREESKQAVRTLLDLSRKVSSGSGGRRWTREELHER
jgi:hypothetical protein